MKLRLLGTGASDGIPSLSGSGAYNAYVREHGGKDVRSRAAALVDDEIKIDFGPDTVSQIHRFGLNAEDWSAVIFTHSDDDHFAPSEFQYFLYPFCENEYMPFTIYGNAKVCARVQARFPGWPIEVIETHAFQPFAHAGYTITPLLATHGADEENHNLLFERDGRKILYATDTGVWQDVTFEYAKGMGIDALVIECTDGLGTSTWAGHLSIGTCTAMVQKMFDQGTLAPDAEVVTTHHSYTGGCYCDLVQALGKYGIKVGYDGLQIEV